MPVPYFVDNSQNENEDPTNKAESTQKIDLSSANELKATLVLNSCGIIDSHMDCHIKGLWTKTLQEQNRLLLLQEHEMEFDKIIATAKDDQLKAFTKTVSWAKLGMSYSGSTEALMFDAIIKQSVNPFMFDLYKQGRVHEHSVGMRYVKMFTCMNINEPTYSSEKANWDKYYQYVVNKDLADQKGFFFAVTEAKLIEGSAVVLGSNMATPTMEIEIEKSSKAAQSTLPIIEPPVGTHQSNTHLLIF
jgi:hypothetical protein